MRPYTDPRCLHGALQATSIGRQGALLLVRRALAATTYASLCVPDDIEERGVGAVPHYHYRSDARRLWGAIRGWGSRPIHGPIAHWGPHSPSVAP